MLYEECRAYLIEKLKTAGIRSAVHLDQKSLDSCNEKHTAAVITESDELTPNGQRTTYRDAHGVKHKRTKKFDEKITFIVTIGEHKAEACEKVYEAFLKGLDEGVYIDENWTEITVASVNWFDEKDQVLKSESAAVMKISFHGGVYEDHAYIKPPAICAGIEMEVRNGGEK